MSKSPSGYFIRSKNAGPIWLTIDLFCDDTQTYERLCRAPELSASGIATLLKSNVDAVKTFKIPALNVIKISLPRPTVQGTVEDRDIHGAQWAYLVQEALERHQ